MTNILATFVLWCTPQHPTWPSIRTTERKRCSSAAPPPPVTSKALPASQSAEETEQVPCAVLYIVNQQHPLVHLGVVLAMFQLLPSVWTRSENVQDSVGLQLLLADASPYLRGPLFIGSGAGDPSNTGAQSQALAPLPSFSSSFCVCIKYCSQPKRQHCSNGIQNCPHLQVTPVPVNL